MAASNKSQVYRLTKIMMMIKEGHRNGLHNNCWSSTVYCTFNTLGIISYPLKEDQSHDKYEYTD